MKTMVPVVHSQVPQLIFYLGSWVTSEKMSAISPIFEGSFYTLLRPFSKEASRIGNWMRESAVSRIHDIQAVFNAANALIVVYYAKKFVNEIQMRFHFSVVDRAAAWAFGTLPVIFTTGCAFTIGMLAMNCFSKETADPKNKQDSSQHKTFQQRIARALHVTKLVLTVGLTCLVKNRLWLLVGLVGSGYSWFKNANIRWLQFSESFEEPYNNGPLSSVQKLIISYQMLHLEPEVLSQDEECSICWNAKPDMVFCTRHVFHKECIDKHFKYKNEAFIGKATLHLETIDYYIHRVLIHTSYKYSTTLESAQLLTCPMCRSLPPQHQFDIKVVDRESKTYSASVTTSDQKDEQLLFERVYAAYNIAQAGLAYLQRYLELTVSIYYIQRIMVITDICGLLGTAYYLHKRIHEKLTTSGVRWHQTAFRIAMVVTYLAVGALFSFVAVSQINTYLQSDLVLHNILAQLAIPPDVLKTINVRWTSDVFLQSLYLMKIVMSVALGFFSKQRLLNLVNVVAPAFSFTAISHLKKILFSQTWNNYPLKQILTEEEIHTFRINESSLVDLTVEVEFFVDSSWVKEADQVKSILKYMYDCMSELLDKSG